MVLLYSQKGFKGHRKEHIQFNHDTLWIGGEQDTGAYQNFWNIYVKLSRANATEYRRVLDLSRGLPQRRA